VRALRRASWLVAIVALGACSGDSSSTNDTSAASESVVDSQVSSSTNAPVGGVDGLPVVAVTYSALESVVAGIVGDSARVEVIIPNGTDPHDFEPSAKDVEMMSSSAIVVANGLDLEEGLEDALAETEKSGVPVFHVADHVTLRKGSDHAHGDEEHGDEEHGDEEHGDEAHGDEEHGDEAHGDEEHGDKEHGDKEHGHGAEDPHIWLDPLTLAEAVPEMAEQIGSVIGADLSSAGAAQVSLLENLNKEIETKMSGLDPCVMITGHDSLGYFAARYGCEILGSVVPSFSTAAEATAKNLAELKALAKGENVKAIFTELGTPADVVEQLAKEVGVEVVELATHLVPEGGGYPEMMSALTDSVVAGLS